MTNFTHFVTDGSPLSLLAETMVQALQLFNRSISLNPLNSLFIKNQNPLAASRWRLRPFNFWKRI